MDLRKTYFRLSAASLRAAVNEQRLADLMTRLRAVVPDISGQYTHGFEASEYAQYWELNMRALHAFQVRCLLDATRELGRTGLVVVDIGDSSGTHARYLRALAPGTLVSRIISANLDPEAVAKIRASGGEAILCRAEELDLGDEHVDLFASFETLEHLTDPVRFLRRLSTARHGAHLLVTVPFRRVSRFGGHHLMNGNGVAPSRLTAESTHIFELSPEDWRRLAWFAGWRTQFERVYWQYPRRSILRATAPIWRSLDYEGFLALLLVPDRTLSDRYVDW
jgi:2-polyprenyl-3-methyl-5-hydroxy-6-metoxy-1,4-benzoquinol methylase